MPRSLLLLCLLAGWACAAPTARPRLAVLPMGDGTEGLAPAPAVASMAWTEIRATETVDLVEPGRVARVLAPRPGRRPGGRSAFLRTLARGCEASHLLGGRIEQEGLPDGRLALHLSWFLADGATGEIVARGVHGRIAGAAEGEPDLLPRGGRAPGRAEAPSRPTEQAEEGPVEPPLSPCLRSLCTDLARSVALHFWRGDGRAPRLAPHAPFPAPVARLPLRVGPLAATESLPIPRDAH